MEDPQKFKISMKGSTKKDAMKPVKNPMKKISGAQEAFGLFLDTSANIYPQKIKVGKHQIANALRKYLSNNQSNINNA